MVLGGLPSARILPTCPMFTAKSKKNKQGHVRSHVFPAYLTKIWYKMAGISQDILCFSSDLTVNIGSIRVLKTMDIAVAQ